MAFTTRRMTAYLALATIVALSATPVASAHPHAWIDLRSTVVLDETGRVAAIEQEWLLDPLYSTLLTEEVGLTPEALRAHAAAMLDRLRAYDYFTEIRIDGKPVTPGLVREFESELRSGRYWIRFVVPLEMQPDPARESLTYSVYDPTYYIEILHLEEDVIAFEGGEFGRCEGQVVPPSPSTDAIMTARAMDVNAKADDSLGALFAERVEIECR